MGTRIYVVKVNVDNDPTSGSLFPWLDNLDPEAVVEMEAENLVSIVTSRDIDRLLDQTPAVIEYDCGEFNWDGSEKVWYLSGTHGGNGWETDNYEADSEQQALLEAIEYLIEYSG